MRRNVALITSFGAVAAIVSSVIAASGADMPVKAPLAPPPPPVFSWSGIYLGGHGGYGWGRGRPDAADTPIQHPDGGFGGIQAGFNYQSPSNIVLGVEADVSFGDLNDSVMDGPSLTQRSKADTFGTARLRLGYAFDRVLPYVTGGLAWTHAKAGMSCAPNASIFSICGATGPFDLTDTTTSAGWTVGGGIEYAFTSSWSAKVEYLHADLGDSTLSFTLPVAGTISGNVSQTLNVVRAGVNYRFGGPGFAP